LRETVALQQVLVDMKMHLEEETNKHAWNRLIQF
jgi:hypothetical protein